MLGILKAGFFFRSFGKGLKNVFTSVRHSFLLVIGIAIIAASAAGLLIHVPLLSRWAPAARIFGTLGGCLGMFIISLSYGTKNLSTSNRDQFEEKLDLAKKGMEETFRKEYDLKNRIAIQERNNEKLNYDLKANIEKLQEKQKEIDKVEFILKDKEDEIKRLESMNTNVNAMSTALKLVVFEAKVKQLDIKKYYYDDKKRVKSRSEITRPTGEFLTGGKIKDTARTYKEYYGIVEQEFKIQGGVDLSQIKIWDEKDAIYFSGINTTTPERIEPKNRQLLGQLRNVKFTVDVDEPKVESLIRDNDADGVMYQATEIGDKTEYKFDDTTKEFMEKSAVRFIELFLAPFNKTVVYAPTREVKDAQPLLKYFEDKIVKIEQERNEKRKLLENMEAAYSKHKEEVLG